MEEGLLWSAALPGFPPHKVNSQESPRWGRYQSENPAASLLTSSRSEVPLSHRWCPASLRSRGLETPCGHPDSLILSTNKHNCLENIYTGKAKWIPLSLPTLPLLCHTWPADVHGCVTGDEAHKAEPCLRYKRKPLRAVSSNCFHSVCSVFTSKPKLPGTKAQLHLLWPPMPGEAAVKMTCIQHLSSEWAAHWKNQLEYLGQPQKTRPELQGKKSLNLIHLSCIWVCMDCSEGSGKKWDHQ